MKARLNHAVIPVRTGKMDLALSFMLAFGFKIEDYSPSGDWGFANFVRNEWGERIQLTLPSDQHPFVEGVAPECDARAHSVLAPMLQWVHVGLECNIAVMRKQIIVWSERHNLTVAFESVPGGKLFVSLQQVFWTDIELVPPSV